MRMVVRRSSYPGRKTTPPSPESGQSLNVPKPASAPDTSLSYDAKTNTVTFRLIGGPTGFQFNGYASGGGTLVLPSNAYIVMPFINKDGTPHSAILIEDKGSGESLIQDLRRETQLPLIPCLPESDQVTRLAERDPKFLERRVSEVMTRTAKTASPADLAGAAVGTMQRHGVIVLPVVDEAGAIVGVVHLHDLMRAGAV
jgi:CBS domain-containing protein